jgi:CheY-like chemotaxis protein
VNQQLAKRLLQKHGHEVSAAGNGLEAVALFEHQAFDLVLMDVQMPQMDGFEATAALRAKEARSGGHVPIIALTAHAMKGDAERCLQAGMDGYVSKPVKADTLFAAIDEAMAIRPPSARGPNRA